MRQACRTTVEGLSRQGRARSVCPLVFIGVQVVNLVTSRVVRIIGKVENTERFLRIALYQVFMPPCLLHWHASRCCADWLIRNGSPDVLHSFPCPSAP